MAINTQFTRQQAIPKDATHDAAAVKGKSVIITGGASGIGEVVMRAMVSAGAYVTFGDLAEDRGQALVSELGADNVAFVPGNVLVWADQLKLFKTALEKSPSRTIDVVIANAGTGSQDDLVVQTEDANGDPIEPKLGTLQTNLIGVAYTAKLAMFYFPKQPAGEGRDRCLIFTSSMSGYLDHAGSPQYNSSKWGVRGLMRSLRKTGPLQNIRVNIIAPWFLATRIMPDQLQAKIRAAGIEFAELDDAASAFLYIASDPAMNGRTLIVGPRSVDQRGYWDPEKDDINPDDSLYFFSAVISGGEPKDKSK